MESQPLEIHIETSRRRLLSAAVFSLGAIICAGLGVPAALYIFVPPKNRSNSNWVDAGTVSNIKIDQPQEITFQRRVIDGWKEQLEKAAAWIVKRPDGTVRAYSPACPHLGCAYRWEGSRRQFVCPCHGSRFGVDGAVLGGPAPRPLDRYQVKVESGRLWLGPVEPPGEAQS
jgi:menaquinol-cytochrome c reductase iron-sulfur subunit